MIVQVPGHIPFKRLYDDDFDTSQILNYAHQPKYPDTTKVVEAEFQERVITRGQAPSYHNPEVVRTLPKPNCSMPQLESSPHVWHFRDTDTGIEFLMFSDGRRKNHFKGTSVEVLLNGNEQDDKKLADAYTRLLDYVNECYEAAQQ